MSLKPKQMRISLVVVQVEEKLVMRFKVLSFVYLSVTFKLSAGKQSRKNTYPRCHLEFNRTELYTSVETKKYLS